VPALIVGTPLLVSKTQVIGKHSFWTSRREI
jgi:hypothetical protein